MSDAMTGCGGERECDVEMTACDVEMMACDVEMTVCVGETRNDNGCHGVILVPPLTSKTVVAV